jgi:hypothetical protein
MKYLILALFICVSILSNAQSLEKNEIGLVVSPLKFAQQESYGLRYLRTINKDLSVRAGLRIYANTNREVRNDTIATSFGTIQYDIRLGLQRSLDLGSFELIKPYVAGDFSFNSELKKESYESYYGYYWNMSLNPVVGLESEPVHRLRVYFEAGGDLNVNLQEYSAPGENYDRKFSYNPIGYLALGIGYKF